MQQVVKAALFALLAQVMVPMAAVAGATEASPPAQVAVQPPKVFATVGDAVITQDEFNTAFNFAARNKFYHGKPPEGEIAQLQREVGDEMVGRVLRLAEARRRGLQPDQEKVRQALADHEQRYASNERWKKDREQVLPALTERLEQNSLLMQLEQSVRDSVVPTAQQVAEYYAAHPDQFTEPEQVRLQMILLKVDPSSPKGDWEKAQQEAQGIVQQLRGGADFADLARQRSGDENTARQGGDLGYQHNGMLPDEVQAAFKDLKPGDLSSPVRLLQGFAVFRLNERKPPGMTSFEAAKERAQQLAQREQRDMAWKALAASLKQQTSVKIDESRYLPLPEPPAGPASSN